MAASALNAMTGVSHFSSQWISLVEDRNVMNARGLDFSYLSKFVA